MAVEQADFAFVERGARSLAAVVRSSSVVLTILRWACCMASIILLLMWLSPDVAARWLRLLTIRALILRILIMFCSKRSRVMRLPLLISAIILAQSGEVVGKHEAPHQGGAQGQEFGGSNGDGGTNQKTFMARIKPLSSQWWLLSPMSMHMVKPANTWRHSRFCRPPDQPATALALPISR